MNLLRIVILGQKYDDFCNQCFLKSHSSRNIVCPFQSLEDNNFFEVSISKYLVR